MKRSLKGASLVEALVASVIFLTVFLMAMDSLMNIARINHSGVSPVEMEAAVRDCLKKIEDGSTDKRSYCYQWGSVEVDAQPYKAFDDLLDVTVTAKAKNGCAIIYRFLICPHSNYD